MELKLAQRISVSQGVFDQLLAQIRNGSLRPGDRLPGEYELTRRLGVGRSSVREALRGLIMLGVVETKPGRGAIVMSHAGIPVAPLRSQRESVFELQKRAVLDLLEVRESLDGQAAELAVRRATPADLVSIEQAALEMEKRIREEAIYYRANMEFHLAIARAAHNGVLTGSLQYLMREVRTFRESVMREVAEVPLRDAVEHRAILRALQERNPAGARRAMVKHIRSFASLVQEFRGPSAPGATKRGRQTERNG
jgi:GntR family transcriptional regulator, transcriptional repressor for pyruvate dehydrogenase complex